MSLSPGAESTTPLGFWSQVFERCYATSAESSVLRRKASSLKLTFTPVLLGLEVSTLCPQPMRTRQHVEQVLHLMLSTNTNCYYQYHYGHLI